MFIILGYEAGTVGMRPSGRSCNSSQVRDLSKLRVQWTEAAGYEVSRKMSGIDSEWKSLKVMATLEDFK